MTKVYEKREFKQISSHLVDIICDLCGDSSEFSDWSNEQYGVDEVTVKYVSGFRYPEDTFLTNTEVDLCPTCFESRLIPWLRSQGAEITEWDQE